MSKDLQRFVIIATPRSGSNWLCTLLDSHPEILCHHELFNPDGVHVAWSLRGTDFDLGDLESRDSDPLALLQGAWSQTLSHNCVGFKINRGQSDIVFGQVIEDPGIRKILVSRRNRLRAFVSEHIAQTSGQWESFPDSAPAESVVPIKVQFSALKAHAQRNQAYLENVKNAIDSSGQDFLNIHYENIGKTDCQRAILAFLGVDQAIRLSGKTRQMNPEPLGSLIENFDELAEQLAKTEFATDLPEETTIDP